MAFNPDKYLAKKSGSEFDPDAYLASKSGQNDSDASPLQSAAEGAVEGLTAGLAPVLGGISLTALDTLSGVIKPQDILERYRQYRDSDKAKSEALKEQNPKSFLGGEVVGTILPALLTGGASSVSSAAEAGAKYGAAQALGSTPADISKGEIVPAALDVGTGAAGGALLGAAGEKLLGALSKTPGMLNKYAAKKAVSAIGSTKGQLKNLIKEDKLIPQGEELLKSGIVSPFRGTEGMLDKAEQTVESSGKEIGDILSKIDNVSINENPELKQQFFNPQSVVNSIKELQQGFTKNGRILPTFESEYNKLDKAVATIEAFGSEPISFKEANELKSLISKTAYGDQGKLEDKLMGQVRGIINDNIEQAADKVAQASGDTDLLKKYIENKQTYGAAKQAVNSLTGKVATDIKANDLGLTDYIAGSAAALAHGGPGAVAAVGLKKLASSYGKSLQATGAKSAANVMSSIATAASRAPEGLKNIGERLIKSDSDLENKLGNILIEAAGRDETGRNALIFSLMQTSKYRELMKEIFDHNVAK